MILKAFALAPLAMTVDCGDRSESPRSRDWNKHDQIDGEREKHSEKPYLSHGCLESVFNELAPFLGTHQHCQ